MGLRPFAGIQTFGSAAQPVFGTTLTAAVVPVADFAGESGAGANPTRTTLAVSSTKGFLAGDVIAIGPAASFVPGTPSASTPKQETVRIVSVNSSTGLTVQGINLAHPSTDYVVLAETCSSVSIQLVSGTHSAYLGNASTVSSSDASVLFVLTTTYTPIGVQTGDAQVYNSSEFWISGTSTETFVAFISTL